MYKLKLLMLIAFVGFLFSNASLASAESIVPTLSVMGEGTAYSTPDMAKITVGVTTHSSDANTAQNTNAATSDKVYKAIRALGISEKDIQTNNYNFYPTYQNENGRSSRINGYTVNNSITVTVRNIDLTGKVIDTALNAGANEVSSLDFSLSNQSLIRKEAMLSAINDARDKAEIIAKGLGKHIVGIKNVSESTGYIGSHRYNEAALFSAKMANADTNIEAGTLSLKATVNIDFILGN